MLNLKDDLQFATYNDVKNKYETLTKINTEWKIEKNQLKIGKNIIQYITRIFK